MKHFPNMVIRASAGTGKTYQLSNRFLGLMAEGAPVDQILATTFTRKAAGEILDRVVERLAAAACDSDGCRKLAAALDRPDLTLERCREMLRTLLRNLHRLRVCTLDSFFSQIASSYCLELGLPPGWRIVEPLEDERLRSEAIEAILRGDSDTDIVRLMHLMTKGEAERSISQLVRETVRGLYSLYAETEESAWQRFPLLRPLPEDALVAAIERIEDAPLPQHKRIEQARQSDVAAARAQQWEQLLESGLARRVLDGEPTYYNKELPPETIAAYQPLLDHIRAVLIGQLAAQTAATYRLLKRFDTAYLALKDARLALRFDDVTRRLARAADRDSLEHLEYRLDAPVSHLLLDEFQDTSLPQWLALRPFAERATHTGGQQEFLFHGGQESFFCVGDVKQAIYGWRGGKSEIFEALEAHLDGLEHATLNQSFRSAPPVIDTVNRVFGSLTQHPNLDALAPPLQSWLQAFHEHSTARGELAGHVTLETTPARGDSQRSDSYDHLAATAARVAELTRQAPGRSIGVLVRRNTVVAELIYLLRKEGVEASEEGGNPLTDSAAVLLLLSLLRMTDHPGDTIARYHVARSPLGRLLGYTSHMSCDGAERLAREIRRRLLEDGYGPTLMRLCEQLRPWCGRRDLRRLDQLVELAFEYQPRASLRTDDFVAHVRAERVGDPSAAAAVRVMTIHQAKGLQFDLVVLPELDVRLVGQPDPCVVGQEAPTEPADRVCLHRNKGIQALLPPEIQQLFEGAVQQTVHEAMCVLYVALTRAVHALHMIVAPAASNERTLPRTFAGLLRAALADGRGEPGSVLFQAGNPDWCPLPGPREEQRRPSGVLADLDQVEQSLEAADSPSSLESQPSGASAEDADQDADRDGVWETEFVEIDAEWGDESSGSGASPDRTSEDTSEAAPGDSGAPSESPAPAGASPAPAVPRSSEPAAAGGGEDGAGDRAENREKIRAAAASARREAPPVRRGPLQIKLAPMPEGRRSGLKRSAPSSLEGGVKVKLGSVLRLDNAAAMARGTMIHAWFEQIRWLEDGLPSPDTLRQIAAGFDGAGLNIDEALRQFHAMVMTPSIGGALRRQAYDPERARDGADGTADRGADGKAGRPAAGPPADMRLEVHNERRFAVRTDQQVLSGTIDRLVLIYNGEQVVGADVIDFKTDAVSGEDPEQLEATVEHYRPQQEAYRSAVAKMFGLQPERISARLLLLGPGIVKEL